VGDPTIASALSVFVNRFHGRDHHRDYPSPAFRERAEAAEADYAGMHFADAKVGKLQSLKPHENRIIASIASDSRIRSEPAASECELRNGYARWVVPG
jgi:hypothetical protein